MAVFATLALIIVGYLIAAWVGSSIPQNSDWIAPGDGVDILVETNGLHTSIVVPIVNEQKDWREVFPSAARPLPSGFKPTHIAIGYGEREIFLHVAEWSDLTLGSALRIVTVGGDALLRTSHYLRPAPSKYHRPLRITHDQYADLIDSIDISVPDLTPGEIREELHGTYSDDSYYEAHGSYTAVNTCNTWVGNRLADAGIPMGLWTPLAGGVMKWVPEPGS